MGGGAKTQYRGVGWVFTVLECSGVCVCVCASVCVRVSMSMLFLSLVLLCAAMISSFLRSNQGRQNRTPKDKEEGRGKKKERIKEKKERHPRANYPGREGRAHRRLSLSYNLDRPTTMPCNCGHAPHSQRFPEDNDFNEASVCADGVPLNLF